MAALAKLERGRAEVAARARRGYIIDRIAGYWRTVAHAGLTVVLADAQRAGRMLARCYACAAEFAPREYDYSSASGWALAHSHNCESWIKGR